MDKPLLFLLLFFIFSTKSSRATLTESEEHSLIFSSPDSASALIDEKLRELPGGVLVPPEVRQEPMPKMDMSSSESRPSMLQFDTFNKHKESASSTTKRLQAYSPAAATLTSSKKKSYQQKPPSTPSLEIALKRIEILASRAGFNMSSVPRRSQLQIVTRIAEKLPTGLRSVVREALKRNDKRVYEFLPEPGRDPLIEDNPEYLSHFLPKEHQDDEIIFNNKKPVAYNHYKQAEEPEEVLIERVIVPQQGPSPSPQGLLVDWKSSREREIIPETHHHNNNHQYNDQELLGSFSENIEQKVEKKSKIHQRTKDENKPVRVSIISKNDDQEQTLTTAPPPPPPSPPPSSKIKYVQVTSPNLMNKTNLFQVESQDYDLTSQEIEAMVEELEKENNEVIVGNKPDPLEFPDHPEHREKGDSQKLKNLEERIRMRQSAMMQNKLNLRRPPPPPPPQVFNRRPHPIIPRPPPPPQQPPQQIKINDVKIKEAPSEFNRECDYFSNELCLLVQDYPIEAISEAIESSPSLTLSLLPREEQQSESETKENNKIQSEGGFLCPSKVAYGKIKKAKSETSKKWKFIVNYGDKTQTLRIEKCLTPGERCSYIQPHYKTACTQVYNYHRLLAWDHEKGLHIDVFKVPTVCTCHVQGFYSPPKPQHQTPAINNRRQFSHRNIVPPNNHPPFSSMTPTRPSFMMMHHHPHVHSRPMMMPFNQQQQQRTLLSKQETSLSNNNDQQELTDLLRQYNSLREKIDVMRSNKNTAGDDDLYGMIRKKRKNNNYSKNKKEPLKKILKKIVKSKKKSDKKGLVRLAKELMRLSKEKKTTKDGSKKSRRVSRQGKSVKIMKVKSSKLEKFVGYIKKNSKKKLVKVKKIQ